MYTFFFSNETWDLKPVGFQLWPTPTCLGLKGFVVVVVVVVVVKHGTLNLKDNLGRD